jgi:saccharopine dehydrogenase-like NADP-dependent oxidoreductase
VADNLNIVVVGLGYVGIPLAVSLARTFDTTGLDINQGRVDELESGEDRTGSVDPATLSAEKLKFTTDATCIADADVVIVAVPTPVDSSNVPDMSLLEVATLTVGQQMTAPWSMNRPFIQGLPKMFACQFWSPRQASNLVKVSRLATLLSESIRAMESTRFARW